MIKDVMEYSGIVTKIRAMRAKLLKSEDYRKIAAMQTVTEVIYYLKETKSYGKLIYQINVSFYQRVIFEKVIVQSLYDDYTRLYRFASIDQKKFLKIFMKRYEVDLIKYCLRIVFNHYNAPFDLDYKKTFFDRYSDIRIDQLIMSNNIDDLVDHLKDTEYYAPLAKIRESGASTLFDYDLALEMYYYSMLWKIRKGNWKKEEQETIKKNLGSQIDLMNLQWIYRAKKYYRMLPPDIYTLLIPIQYRLTRDEFKNLVEAPSIEEFFRCLNESFYGRKYQFDEQHNVEKIERQYLKHIVMTAYQYHPYSLASFLGYLFLKEEEIYRITTALECIRYGLSEKEILGYILQDFRYQGGSA